MVMPGVVVFTLEGNSPGLYRPYSSATPRGSVNEDRQFGEVIPAVDSDASSMVCGVEAECVRHRHRRSALQPDWGPAGPPLPGVQRLCLA